MRLYKSLISYRIKVFIRVKRTIKRIFRARPNTDMKSSGHARRTIHLHRRFGDKMTNYVLFDCFLVFTFIVHFDFMYWVWDGCSSLTWAIADNVIVFTTSHRLKAPPGAGCACAVSRCGCVRLNLLPRILKFLIEIHRAAAGPRGDRVAPMREYGVR